VLLEARLDDRLELQHGRVQRARVVEHHDGAVLDVVQPALAREKPGANVMFLFVSFSAVQY
jgi:hypothetical protein